MPVPVDASGIKNLWPFVAPPLLALGFISAAQHVYRTLSVLLQTFIIPGISVSFVIFTRPLVKCRSVETIWCKKRSMGCCNGCYRWNWKGVLLPTSQKRI